MILGMPAPLFWYGVAVLGSAGAMIGVVVVWFRSVSRDADLGARWVNNCGSREKAVALLVAYEKLLDAKLRRGLRAVEAEDQDRDDKLGEQMLRDALREDGGPRPRSLPYEVKLMPTTHDPFRAGLEQLRGELLPCSDVPSCGRGGPNPEDTQ